MGKQYENKWIPGRSIVSAVRNRARYVIGGMQPLRKTRIAKLAARGLEPKMGLQLANKSKAWRAMVLPGAGKVAIKPDEVRVDAQRVLSNRVGAVPSFTGSGLDEHVATRDLRQAPTWHGASSQEAKDIFGGRSRTADLIWRTQKPVGAAALATWNPIAGHTPSVKSQLIAGTTAAITSEHNTRDALRSAAVMKTLGDVASPRPFSDMAVMGSLATIKHMSSPATELAEAKADVQALHGPRYAVVTGNKDLRQPAHFDEMVAHVQEARERTKWETASVMKGDSRLSPLVPHVIGSYLGAHGNDPLHAMESFRNDVHKSYFAPPINAAKTSDTEDLGAHSLHQLAESTKATGTRRRALSDARWLPPVAPTNSRGI
jgi:hypothetical protein